MGSQEKEEWESCDLMELIQSLKGRGETFKEQNELIDGFGENKDDL